jgi:hypothetical protein
MDLVNTLSMLAAEMDWDPSLPERYHQDWMSNWNGEHLVPQPLTLMSEKPYGSRYEPMGFGSTMLDKARVLKVRLTNLSKRQKTLSGIVGSSKLDDQQRATYLDSLFQVDRELGVLEENRKWLATSCEELGRTITQAQIDRFRWATGYAKDTLGSLMAEETGWLNAASHADLIYLQPDLDCLRVARTLLDPDAVNKNAEKEEDRIRTKGQRASNKYSKQRSEILNGLYPALETLPPDSTASSVSCPADIEQWLDTRLEVERPKQQVSTRRLGKPPRNPSRECSGAANTQDCQISKMPPESRRRNRGGKPEAKSLTQAFSLPTS